MCSGQTGGPEDGTEVMGKQEATDSMERASTVFLVVARTSLLRDDAGARLDGGTTRGTRNKVLNEQHCPFFKTKFVIGMEGNVRRCDSA